MNPIRRILFPRYAKAVTPHRGQRSSQYQPRPRSLLTRLIIGVMTVAVSIFAYGGYQAMRSLILNNLKENALLEVQQGVNDIDQWLIARKAEVEALANTPTLQTMNWALVGPYLKARRSSQSSQK